MAAQTGIYKITNLINGKIYIGQSVDINRRFNAHITAANNQNNNEHYTPIHNAIRKYGKDNFSLEIVELCDAPELDEKEKYYIQLFNANDRDIGYNLTIGGSGDQSPYIRPVLQYDFEGNLLKEWSSFREAAQALNINPRNIWACCYGQKSAGGYQWKFKDDISKTIDVYKKDIYYQGLELGRKRVKIKGTNIITGEEFYFDSIKDSGLWLIKNNYTTNSINSIQSRISAIKNKDKVYCGFKWYTLKGE